MVYNISIQKDVYKIYLHIKIKRKNVNQLKKDIVILIRKVQTSQQIKVIYEAT